MAKSSSGMKPHSRNNKAQQQAEQYRRVQLREQQLSDERAQHISVVDKTLYSASEAVWPLTMATIIVIALICVALTLRAMFRTR